MVLIVGGGKGLGTLSWVLLRILYRGIYEKTSVATAAKGAESR